MSSGASSRRIILVAVDASPHSLAALETAAAVAATLGAELRCVYVEDINLLRMAELPFARAIASSGLASPLTVAALESQLRRQEEIARRAAESAGARTRVTWSFTVVRGAVQEEVVKAASEAEIVTIGRAGWSVRGGRRLGSLTRSLLATGPVSVLMVERSGIEPPLAAVYDGSAQSKRALALGAALAGSRAHLYVFLAGDAPDLQASADEQLQAAGIRALVQAVTGYFPRSLAATVRRSGARTLLLPASIYSDNLQAVMMLEASDRSVFVVR